MQKKYLVLLIVMFVVCMFLTGWAMTDNHTQNGACRMAPEDVQIAAVHTPHNVRPETDYMPPIKKGTNDARCEALGVEAVSVYETLSQSNSNVTPKIVPSQEQAVVTTPPAVVTVQDSGLYTDNDAIMLAKLMGVECPSVASTTEQACVAWCVLNRYDAGFASSISGVITAPYQFAYNSSTAVRQDLYELALDVLSRWAAEKNGATDVGRVLPPEYKWFKGDYVAHNYFRDQYQGGNIWDYSLPSPYST